MCSMGAQPHPRSVLQRAIRTGDAALALRAAGELERVDLEDAFAICLLLRADRARYERACVRWLERYAAEVEGATLGDVVQIASGFQLIFARVVPRNLRPMERLLRRRQLHRAADRLTTMLERTPRRHADLLPTPPTSRARS
jgi:hypothetical protein